jgi:enoyl-CoA hydratase
MSVGTHTRIERLGQLLRITVDRPSALNAVGSGLLNELLDAVSEAAEDPDARVVILTGGGSRAFIAGADIKELSGKSPEEGLDFSARGHRLTRMLEEMEKPVIAAINGAALGGGCELALACDLRVAGDRALFGQPEVKLGVIPGWGGTVRLARIVGEGLAREMVFSGRILSAEEALRVGLLNRVVPHESLPEEALRIAETIARQGPVALAFAKRSMNGARFLDREAAARLESELFARCFTTEDQREGMEAFMQKRQPEFKGR